MAPNGAEAAALCAIIIICLILKRRKRRRKNRKIWVKPWLRKRATYGAYNSLLQELRLTDTDCYKNFIRMDEADFDYLLSLVQPFIERSSTRFREPIPVTERLALTLRFLATGDSYTSLSYLYRISRQAIGTIVPETCQVISKVLKHKLQVPQTESEWKRVEKEFAEKWNFPNCIGAMDGKHVLIKPPHNSGSYYFNYKHTFSLVLLALVDANYKFLFVDIGSNGRVSDGGVFKNSILAKAISTNALNSPCAKPLAEGSPKVPHVIVADDVFPLKENIMKPYSRRGLTKEERIFNYRLCRARRVVENAFGILANRFRVFMTPISLQPNVVEDVVLAACSLHNFLRGRYLSSKLYTPIAMLDSEDHITHEVTPAKWRQESVNGMLPLSRQCGNRFKPPADEIREEFCSYFNSENGAVEWQWNVLEC